MSGPAPSPDTCCRAEASHAVPVEASATAFGEYIARDPTESVLVRTVRKYLPRLLEAAASDGQWTLPRFVEQALRDLATCGDFTRGFTHFEARRHGSSPSKPARQCSARG